MTPLDTNANRVALVAESAIDLYREYIDQHSYSPDRARHQAVCETVEGATARIEPCDAAEEVAQATEATHLRAALARIEDIAHEGALAAQSRLDYGAFSSIEEEAATALAIRKPSGVPDPGDRAG